MLTLKPIVTSVALDNSGIVVLDTTGAYSAGNTGGYGTPNPALATFSHVEIALHRQGQSASVVHQGTSASISALQSGLSIAASFSDGAYAARQYMGYPVTVTDGFDISVDNIVTCVTNPFDIYVDGFTHISFPQEPYVRYTVVSTTPTTIVVKELWSDGLTPAVQQGILYWWQGESRMYTSNDAGLMLAQRLAYKQCQCEEELEWYCMHLRAGAMNVLGDYAGAQKLLNYLNQRLCLQHYH